MRTDDPIQVTHRMIYNERFKTCRCHCFTWGCYRTTPELAQEAFDAHVAKETANPRPTWVYRRALWLAKDYSRTRWEQARKQEVAG